MADTAKFCVGDMVSYAVDNDILGIVTGVVFRSCGVRYMVAWGEAGESEHDDVELRKSETVFSTKQ